MNDEQKSFKVKANEFVFFIDHAQVQSADFIKKSPAEFNLIKDHRSINIKIIASDVAAKKFEVEVDGENFDVEIKNELDQMLEKMGFGVVANKQIKEIKAPMPGLVLQVAVK